MRRLIAFTALLTLVVGEAAAQCGSSCASTITSTARLLEGWHPSPQWPGWQLCYVRGVIVAGYRQETDAYCTYDAAAQRWSQITAPPWGARAKSQQAPRLNFGIDEHKLKPAVKEDSDVRRAADEWAAGNASAKKLIDDLVKLQAARPAEAVQNFGVESSRLSHGGDRYLLTRNGVTREIGRDDAHLTAGSLTDDSTKPRLTVIGSEEQRKRVLADFEAAPLAEWKPKLVLHAYAPDHWHVAKYGFKTDGQPTIYLQAPEGMAFWKQDDKGAWAQAKAKGGEVLHRQDDYAGGPQVLAQAIRRADPSYDPAKDGNAAKPKAPEPDAADGLSGLLAKLPGPKWLYVVGVAVAGLYLFRGELASKSQALAESFEAAQSPVPRTRQQFGYRPIARPDAPPPAPPQGGSAMLPPPLPVPPAAIQSRPELTIGRLLQDQLEREQREEEAAKRRAAEREAERAAFRKFAGLDVPAPNPVPVPAPSPEPDQKG